MSDGQANSQEARLALPGTDELVSLQILSPSIGKKMIDIRSLPKQSDMFTFDPGFTGTGNCRSNITFVDGDEGILLYRGYPIEQLVVNCDVLDVAYLLLNGDLATARQKAEFDESITRHTMVHEQIHNIYRGFRRDSHPMAVMCGVVGALAAFYHDSLDIFDPQQRMIASHRIIAKMPTIAAMAYKYHVGQPFVYPRNDLEYASNFLHMLFSVPCEPYVVNEVGAKALAALLIMQADHEQNASTATVRMVGTTRANPFACIAAGIASLWGPLHGGANQDVVETLQAMQSGGVKMTEYLARAKDRNDPFRLPGIGHRIYKNYDPRAKILQSICREVLAAYGRENDPILKLAIEIEKIVLEDDYFASRKLYPNVDFYSGIIMKTIGIPINMFTAIFAVARTIGWISHWNEMIVDPETKICRPRQLYTEEKKRDFVSVEDRLERPPLVG